MNIRKPFADDKAKWIWSAEGLAGSRPARGPVLVRYFRRKFSAPAGVRLVVHVTADSRYKLWCNGKLVGRGPAKGDIAHQFYDSYDVSSLLSAGRNVLAAQVEHYGKAWCDYNTGGPSVSQMTACPAFALDADLLTADGHVAAALATDGHWKVLEDAAYGHHGAIWQTPCAGMQEDFDAAAYPHGFAEAAYDDSTWAPATELDPAIRLDCDRDSMVPHRLVPRMIEPLREEAPRRFARVTSAEGHLALDAWQGLVTGRPVRVPAGKTAGVWLDAAVLQTGFPCLEFSGRGRATLTYMEAAIVDGRKPDRTVAPTGRPVAEKDEVLSSGHCRIVLPAGTPKAQHDIVTCRGAAAYEPFHWRTFRWVYLEVEAGPGGLAVDGLTYRPATYPFDAHARFECSDPEAAAIWDLCWRTARLCAHETYEDCPYYEQLQYGGDTQVQAMISYAVAGDASLARQWLYQFDWSRQPNGLTRSRYPSRVPQTIPYWTLHWVMAVRDYHEHTGDAQAAAELLPGVLAAMDYFRGRAQPDGTIGRLDGWRISDWCPDWTDFGAPGVPPGAHDGEAALDSLMTLAALEAALELLRGAGKTALGARVAAARLASLTEWRDQLRGAAHRVYFSPRHGLYLDRPVKARRRPEPKPASAYTNVWAILAGMPADAAKLAERIVRDPGLCRLTMFSLFFAWRALARADRYDLMPETLGLWREMVRHGFSTSPEVPEFSAVRSECHAWGAGPLVEYTREVLGVRPAKPGYAAIEIRPHIAGLTHAAGRVPLARTVAAALAGPGGEIVAPPTRHNPADAAPRPRIPCVDVRWRIEGKRFILDATAPKGRPCIVVLPDGKTRRFPNGGKMHVECALGAGSL